MKKLVRRFIRRTMRRDIIPFTPHHSAEARLARCLASQKIDLVLDVGANAGGFALQLIENGYQGRVVSFEPIGALHAYLKRQSERYPNWTIAEPCAVGAETGTVQLNVSRNLSSSSVLGMMENHLDVAPESALQRQESVPLRRLDDLAVSYVRKEDRVFVKLDVQGYEDRVLDGATALMTKLWGLQVEMSLVPLYEGQVLFSLMDERIRAAGFELWGMDPVLTDARVGRVLQFDALYMRGPLAVTDSCQSNRSNCRDGWCRLSS